MARPTALTTFPANIPSSPPARRSANDRFSTPLFPSPSELLFPQLLCSHNYLRCPVVFLGPGARQLTSHQSRITSHAFSWVCRLFASLASLFRIRFLCFQ